uniref:Uncharacterized protein n=1 Tax=Homalodisca liturata TaxID=320908 RepID=A0A1B6I512_9HEMI
MLRSLSAMFSLLLLACAPWAAASNKDSGASVDPEAIAADSSSPIRPSTPEKTGLPSDGDTGASPAENTESKIAAEGGIHQTLKRNPEDIIYDPSFGIYGYRNIPRSPPIMKNRDADEDGSDRSANDKE